VYFVQFRVFMIATVTKVVGVFVRFFVAPLPGCVLLVA
jgi:hypothetical protein